MPAWLGLRGWGRRANSTPSSSSSANERESEMEWPFPWVPPPSLPPLINNPPLMKSRCAKENSDKDEGAAAVIKQSEILLANVVHSLDIGIRNGATES